MNFLKTELEGVFIIEPQVFGDDRGYFIESYNQKKWEEAGFDLNFKQDNESSSSYGVIRGLHFQKPPYAQTKLVRVVKGEILDVAVDLRVGSPTYGKHISVILNESNKRQLLVPKGFAHGFSVLSETAIVNYKCDEFYHAEMEESIKFNDETLNIDWKIDTGDVLISDKDLKSEGFNSYSKCFSY